MPEESSQRRKLNKERMQIDKILYAIDQPSRSWFARIKSPFIVNGWIIPGPESSLKKIEIKVNGKLRALATTGLRRADVAGVYPDRDSLWSGFLAEVFLDDLANRRISVEINAVFEEGEMILDQFEIKIKGLDRVVPARPRNWRYADILACPLCLGPLDETELVFKCRECQREHEKRRGIPIFKNDGEVILSHLLETNPTNQNAEEHTRTIQSHSLVLDLGAGNPRESEHHPNVVFHEFVQYAHTDVVNLFDRLPYREGTFDAVISKAAFEHLVRPWEMADEIYRVLKPGGYVTVDTAFMFPLHGDPYHFFNMTLDGAKEIFKRFETIRFGVKPYQSPSFSFRAQMSTALEHLQSEVWRQRITEWRDLIDGTFDSALDAKGHERLAAGVYFEGTKPV